MLMGGVSFLRSSLGFQAKGSEVPKEGKKDVEGIACWFEAVGKQDRGIQGSHVAVNHVLHHSRHKHVGVASFKRLSPFRLRDRGALSQVLSQEQRIDLGGVSPDKNVLVGVGEDPGLQEKGIAQQLRKGEGFLHILEVVLLQRFRVMVEEPLDVLPFNVGAALLGEAEVLGRRLQPITFHLPRRDIVVLQKKERIDHVPAEKVHAREINDPLRHREPRPADLW